jgi:acetoin utilization deacetylase AcuC-like enzyme
VLTIVIVVDLDAHQGNGHERDFIGDKNTFIMDVFNQSIYPVDAVVIITFTSLILQLSFLCFLLSLKG